MKNSGISVLVVALILIQLKMFEMLLLPYLSMVSSSLGAPQKPRARMPNKLSMSGTGVDPHGWQFGSGNPFFWLHLWLLDTAAPQRGRAKCLKASVHTSVSSLRRSLSTRLQILSGLVVFWELMFSSRPQQTPWEAADLLCFLRFLRASICPALPWALT